MSLNFTWQGLNTDMPKCWTVHSKKYGSKSGGHRKLKNVIDGWLSAGEISKPYSTLHHDEHLGLKYEEAAESC